MEYWIGFWTAVWVGSSRLTHLTVNWLCNSNSKPAAAPEKPAKTAPKTQVEGAGESEEKPATEAEAGAAREQPKPTPKTAEKTPAKSDDEGSALLRWVGLLIAAAVAKGLPWTTNLAAGLAVAWVLTSIALGYITAYAQRPAAEQKEKTEKETAGPDPAETLTRDDVAPLLHGLLKESGGVHLKALAEALPARPKKAPWATRDVRALLDRVGVRVRPGVRVPGVGGREGVHRDDVPPLPSPTSGPPLVGVVVPGQSNNNNPRNAPGFRIEDDPENPARAHVHHHERT
ncbi:hypothetical protein ACFWXI_06610 [[Kitasatospora] papulosa]|uniref:hypothetical protein n=1 Tax=[Kitasatospora] papulosa TaxID=1464011 RepID=UPI00368AF8C9